MKTEKISSLVLYVVFAVIILLFGVFFTYGYDNQYVANPKFNDPLMLDGVMILMYAMVAITALLIVWSLVKSFVQNMGGPKGENLSGVPGGTISAVSVAILVVSLLVGFFAPSETIVANGDVVTDMENFYYEGLCEDVANILRGTTECLYKIDYAIDAILDGQRNVMIGIKNDKIIYIPFTDAIRSDKPLNLNLIKVLDELSI